MKTSDVITWVFQHQGLSMTVAGALALLLLAISIWGIRRTLRRRKDALVPLNMTAGPALNDVADAARAAAERAENGDDTGEISTEALPGDQNDVSIPEPEPELAPEAEAEPEPELETEPEPEPEPDKFVDTDFRAITQAVFDRNFPRLDNAAYAEAAANYTVFADRLAQAATERLSPDEIAAISHADIQLLLCSLLGDVSKREDGEKYGVLIALLVGRIKHHDNPNIAELMDHAIAEIGSLNVDQLRVVIMCLYLRGFQLKTGGLAALERVVKYALDFGMGANFANLRTGLLFTRGLLMHNGGLERVEIQILRRYAADFQDNPEMPKNMERAAAIKLVHEKLNLSPDQCAVMDAWGQTQSGHATATGIGWAAAAAFIEHRTKQPADWERVIS